MGGGGGAICGLFSDFILFVHRLGRTQGCLWMASHWTGHVWVATEFNFSRDSARCILQIFPTPLHQSFLSLQYSAMLRAEIPFIHFVLLHIHFKVT
jgi:hypothetical protein